MKKEKCKKIKEYLEKYVERKKQIDSIFEDLNSSQEEAKKMTAIEIKERFNKLLKLKSLKEEVYKDIKEMKEILIELKFTVKNEIYDYEQEIPGLSETREQKEITIDLEKTHADCLDFYKEQGLTKINNTLIKEMLMDVNELSQKDIQTIK